MRFLLLFTQLAIIASSLDAAPVSPLHRRLSRRQTDGSVPQLSPDATTDGVPSQLAEILNAACNAANGGTCSRDLTQIEDIVQNIINDLILAFNMVVPACDASTQASQAASSAVASTDPSDGEPVNDPSDPSKAQLGDFSGPSADFDLDDSSTTGGSGSGDGSTADGSTSPEDTGSGIISQGDSGGDDGSGDFGALNSSDTGDAVYAGPPLANDDGTSQSAASSSSDSDDPNNMADLTEDASNDAANLDSQGDCSDSTCSGSDDPSVSGFPTTNVPTAALAGADSGSDTNAEFNSGPTGTGDIGNAGLTSANDDMDTTDSSNALSSVSSQLEVSDTGTIRNAASSGTLGDGSGLHTWAGDGNLDPSKSSTETAGDGTAGTYSSGSSSTVGVPSPDSDLGAPWTGVSGPSSGSSAANAQGTDPIQSGSSAVSTGSHPGFIGDPSATGDSFPPSISPSTASNETSSISNSNAEESNASGLLVVGSGGGQPGNVSGDNSVPQTELVAPSFGMGEGTGPAVAGSLPNSSGLATGNVPPPALGSPPSSVVGNGGDGDDDDGFGFGVQRNGLGGGDDTTGSSPPQQSSAATCSAPTGDLSGHIELSVPGAIDLCASAAVHGQGQGSP